MSILEKYADLLTNYCLNLQEGERVYVSSTWLAEPLLQQFYKSALRAGAIVYFNLDFGEQQRILLQHGNDLQLGEEDIFQKRALSEFDAFLKIRAPFNLKELQGTDQQKQKRVQEAGKEINKTYFRRIAEGSLKRSLCQFPTIASAQEAGMALSEYEQFVYNACNLYADDPVAEWLKVREFQQKIVDHLNTCSDIRYQGPDFDISFKTTGRTWINSDGRNNMPSGEVFSSPVEDSVNGVVRFSYPSIYAGQEVEDITLWVENGEVTKWEAKKGKELLDQIFSIEGARYFGEVAVGTNYQIDRFTKNILFDEKIGGTIHMAIGQSYLQTGGKNESAIHWDMIADMGNGGMIFADGEKIYENGKFLI